MMGAGGGVAQRIVLRVDEPTKPGARIAQARSATKTP